MFLSEKDKNKEYSSYSYKPLLCKSVGFGALLKLIKNIYPLVEKLNSEEEIKNKIEMIFNKTEKVTKLFSEKGATQIGTSGQASVGKLYIELKKELGFK